MTSEQPLPPLRQALEAVQIQENGKPLIVLKDTEGLTGNSYVFTPAAVFIAGLLDGQRTFSEVRSAFAEQTGNQVDEEELRQMLVQLEEADLLETPKVQQKRKEMWATYLAAPVRPMAHHKGGYPEQPNDLDNFLSAFLSDPQGPGKPLPIQPAHTEPPFLLVSPHIDFHRGGPAYAWAYQALADGPPPDIMVGLGVAHLSPESPWVFTAKAYDTPYGPLPLHRELFNAMSKKVDYPATSDEWVHRGEHSLEFQAVWLKKLWRDQCPAWVPILCSTFSPIAGNKNPSQMPSLEKQLKALGEELAARRQAGQKILIVAGIDLAHVGPRFGDSLTLGPELEQRVEREDRLSLQHALTLDADGFYASVVADDHWRKVCGLSALYTALRLTKAMAGETKLDPSLLAYGQAPDPLGGLVSFTSAIFRPKP